MASSFETILKKASIFKEKDVLSPHYLPETLPHREREIEAVMKLVSAAIKCNRTQNLFIYGKTGTGKTSSVKHVMDLFEREDTKSRMFYMNCRIYNTRYRVLQHVVKEFIPEFDKPGYGVSVLLREGAGLV